MKSAPLIWPTRVCCNHIAPMGGYGMNKESNNLPRITKIWAKNFKSIEGLELDLSPLTVLVGPNASGKSNIADIPKFVSDAVRDGLDSTLTARGQSAVKHTARGKNITVGVGIEIEDGCVVYEFSLQVTADKGYRIKHEILKLQSKDSMDTAAVYEIRDGEITKPSASRLANLVKSFTMNSELLAMPRLWPLLLSIENSTLPSNLSVGRVAPALELLKNVRSYHIFPNILRHPQQAELKYPLAENGSNLTSVLYEMKTRSPQRYDELLSTLKSLVPAVVDVAVKSAGSHLYLRFTHQSEGGERGPVLDASQESDGTLWLLGLLAALYQEPPPGLVIIEEPELAIHPGALPYVAELMEETARLRMPMLVTTHSPDFLDLVPVDSIRAVELVNGGTTAGPVSEHQRAAAMKKLFTPGEIHRMEGLHPRSLAAS